MVDICFDFHNYHKPPFNVFAFLRERIAPMIPVMPSLPISPSSPTLWCLPSRLLLFWTVHPGGIWILYRLWVAHFISHILRICHATLNSCLLDYWILPMSKYLIVPHVIQCLGLNKNITCLCREWPLVSALGITGMVLSPARWNPRRSTFLKCVGCAWSLEGKPAEHD